MKKQIEFTDDQIEYIFGLIKKSSIVKASKRRLAGDFLDELIHVSPHIKKRKLLNKALGR